MKRERAEHTCECGEIAVLAIKEAEKPQGNAAAMREALTKIYTCVDDCDNYDPESKLDEVIGIADAALSAPARNCDVGTPEEQAERFRMFCMSHRHSCFDCSAYKRGLRCLLVWELMPYEEGANDGK